MAFFPVRIGSRRPHDLQIKVYILLVKENTLILCFCRRSGTVGPEEKLPSCVEKQFLGCNKNLNVFVTQKQLTVAQSEKVRFGTEENSFTGTGSKVNFRA